jgi:hypothetical protein
MGSFKLDTTNVAISTPPKKKKIAAVFITNPIEGVYTMMLWLGLRGPGFLTAILAVA